METIYGTESNDDGIQNPKLNGTDFDDEFYARAGNDWLNGFGGNDFLQGGLDADKMFGGQGDDTYVVDNYGDQVIEAINEGRDTVKSWVSYTLSNTVENLTIIDTLPVNGTGNALNNNIQGNKNKNTLIGLDGDDSLNGGAGNDILMAGTGNDILSGGAGADKMYGGTGSDKYYVDDAADMVSEALGDGFDTVTSSISFTLSSGVEDLWLSADTTNANLSGTGNALNNHIYTGGVSSNNTLSGLAGNDYLSGGSGKDTLLGGTGNDTLVGAWLDNAGKGEIDTLTGGSGADRFVLGAADNGEFPYMVRFYNDGKLNTFGTTDYALITDFNAAQDSIQLAGFKSDYMLSNVSINGVSGTGIYIKGSSPFVRNELIGVVQNVAANTLSLNSSSFNFVSA